MRGWHSPCNSRSGNEWVSVSANGADLGMAEGLAAQEIYDNEHDNGDWA
jgi:hypothetical protein